jgi:hypothetical protein
MAFEQCSQEQTRAVRKRKKKIRRKSVARRADPGEAIAATVVNQARHWTSSQDAKARSGLCPVF